MQYNNKLNDFSTYEPSDSWARECELNRILLHHIAKHEIHVLLVDHHKECLVSTAKMLELYSYKVSRVEQASTALMMLSNGWKFDLVIANVHSPELLGFKLLQEAVNMKILVILMSDVEDPFMARKVIENGAFLFVKKPVSMELLKHLWQYVIGERKQKDKKKERPREMIKKNEKISSALADGIPQANNATENDTLEKSKGKTGMTISGQEAVNDESEPSNSTHRFGKIIWTSELHAKFLDAVKELGEGRCFPAEIMALMNVPGLTRMQVASHLQKCRRNTWRYPRDRKRRAIAPQPASHEDETPKKSNSERRYGLMPSGESSSQITHEPACMGP